MSRQTSPLRVIILVILFCGFFFGGAYFFHDRWETFSPSSQSESHATASPESAAAAKPRVEGPVKKMPAQPAFSATSTRTSTPATQFSTDDGTAPASSSEPAISTVALQPLPQQVAGVNQQDIPPSAFVSGKVTLKGIPANPDTLIKVTDARCKHDDPNFKTENWKIGAKGELADVVVWIEGAQAMARPEAAKPVINQIGCRYVPHVTAIPRGTTVTFQNSDPTLHNVHAVRWEPKYPHSLPTELFNFSQIHTSGQPKQDDKKLNLTGIVKLQCNVHPWMNAWVLVVNSSWLDVTDAEGELAIGNVPDGSYIVKAWHSQFEKLLEQKIKVIKGSAVVNFEFDAANAGQGGRP